MRDTIDMELVRKQHSTYRQTLVDLGLEVIEVPPDDEHPDACFVEDNAVVHGGRALVCRMGAASRRGEVGAIEEVLKEHMKTKMAEAPATVEGGDVIHLPNRLISGVSERTNADGVKQMREWLGVRVDSIVDTSMMHLKSHVTYLQGDAALATKRFANHPALKRLSIIIVPNEESYAADTLTVNGTVIMPSGCPRTAQLLHDEGFETVAIDMSEFEKCGGAITCLSIIS
jgi:dimethylargininase